VTSHDALPGPSPQSAGPGSVVVRWFGAPGAVALAVASGTTLLAVVDPSEPGHYPPCPVRALTGLYCPGCGSLRAVHALAHGDVLSALDLNALFVVSVPFMVGGYVWWVRSRWRRRRGASSGLPLGAAPERPSTRAASWVGVAFLVFMLAFGVLRNLPAFAVLAP
jgi:hypothetical protein